MRHKEPLIELLKGSDHKSLSCQYYFDSDRFLLRFFIFFFFFYTNDPERTSARLKPGRFLKISVDSAPCRFVTGLRWHESMGWGIKASTDQGLGFRFVYNPSIHYTRIVQPFHGRALVSLDVHPPPPPPFLPPRSFPSLALSLTCSLEQSAKRFTRRFVQLGGALRSLRKKAFYSRLLTLFPVYVSCIQPSVMFHLNLFLFHVYSTLPKSMEILAAEITKSPLL